MKAVTKKFHEYQFEYHIQPGKWMSEQNQNQLKEQLMQVNSSSGKNLNYGIFDPSLSADAQREFFTTSNICIIKEKQVPVGFFYNVILSETPVPAIHAGLVMLARNSGHDLLSASYAYMTYLQYRKFGSYFYTNISSTPSIVGVFSDTFSEVWPSYKANQIKPPSKQYLRILEVLEEKYIKKYFQASDLKVDKKRFVLKSDSQSMGFETDLKKLSRYSKPESNYFCMYWLDYSKGEDLIQVGKVRWGSVLKLNLFVAYQRIRGFFGPSQGSRGENTASQLKETRG